MRKNENNEKISCRQNKCCKKYTLFFSHELQPITVLFLIRNSRMS